MKRVLCFLLVWSCLLRGEEHYLGIIAIFRDEAPYIKEWIEYHRMVGVDHFYLYNHYSKDHYLKVLKPYIEEGVVELIDWICPVERRSQWVVGQCRAYQDGIRRAMGKCYWVSMIDLDEFIFPKAVWTVSEFLKDYEEFSGVGINWHSFGTSGIKQLDPNCLMIEQLIKRAKANDLINGFVKTIAKPSAIALEPEYRLVISNRSWSAHKPKFLPDHTFVDANKKTLNTWRSKEYSQDVICINHYKFRDENFFHNVKLKRPNIDEQFRNIRIAESKEANKVYDRSILRYVEPLKKRVFGD